MVNSIKFGTDKLAAVNAVRALVVKALEEAETASGEAATTAQAGLATASAAATAAFGEMVKQAYDDSAAALLSPADKKLVATGKAALVARLEQRLALRRAHQHDPRHAGERAMSCLVRLEPLRNFGIGREGESRVANLTRASRRPVWRAIFLAHGPEVG
ncbi:MAG: hypothetical protein JWN44_4030 [Myxococcales bacterium]|nr:hypothetical protein [Myxococcales bacterium]